MIRDLRAHPLTAEGELIMIEFMELPDSEQKAILLRALIQHASNIDWLVAQLKK